MPNNEMWRKEFDEKFIQDMSWINTDPSGVAVKSWFSEQLTLARREERDLLLKAVEAEMLDKIYYIGNELPQVKADVRDKFVLLGYPQKFLDDLKSRFSPTSITRNEETQ